MENGVNDGTDGLLGMRLCQPNVWRQGATDKQDVLRESIYSAANDKRVQADFASAVCGSDVKKEKTAKSMKQDFLLHINVGKSWVEEGEIGIFTLAPKNKQNDQTKLLN